jgi:5-formyltetrahydrofolate cyclo-ligase
LKQAFRREAAARRRACVAGLDPVAAAMALAANIYGALMEHPRGVVNGYLAIADEIDPGPAMLVLAQVGWRRALPVVVAKGAPLEFRGWQPGDALEDGPLSTRHPAAGAALTPDVLLVPMLAFDKAGMRMGWGGGFYDRTIAGLRAGNPNLLAIGVAFAGQEVDKVPSGPHDAALDAVATEAGMNWTRGQG